MATHAQPFPIVSVLMTAYNREQYIAEAIESVLNSSFTDFELIIVDDCSTDATVDVARGYLADDRVQLHINDNNLGDYPNRNRAAEFARGKYLKYVDADDLIYSHGLKLMVEIMEEFPQGAVGWAVSQDMAKPYPYLLSPEEAYRTNFSLNRHIFSKAPLSTIIRADAFKSVGGFVDTEGPRGDYATWLKMAASYPVVLMPDGVIWWREHPEQESQYRLKNQANDISRQYHINLTALEGETCPLTDWERTNIIKQLQRRQARLIFLLSFTNSPLLAWNIYQLSKISLKTFVLALIR